MAEADRARSERDPRRQRRRHRRAREAKGRDAAFIDRLTLNDARIEAMAQGLRDIAALPDPVGDVIAAWTRPNGLQISRVRMPLGVIGIIYRSAAQRDRRCRRALPQVRQRRDPARRLGQLSHLARDLPTRWSKASPPPACRRMRSSSCRPPTAPRSA